jgi:peptidoglycan-associated lipoprotein
MTAALCAAMVLWGCPKAPQQALDDAAQALLDARDRSDCAEEKFRAAEALLQEAHELVEQKQYDAAERKARAAERLAREAREYADANWEDCQRRKELARQAGMRTEITEETVRPGQNGQIEELRLMTVYFPYDSAEISDQSHQALEDNIRWLRQNPGVTLLLEGHTDERGTPEYNLALGERRAHFVRRYLVQRGVDDKRLIILSYGEEKPVAFGQSEADFARNRRVEFIPQK